MRTATLVLTVFGALWGAMALSYAHAPAWTLAAPALLSLALAAAVFTGIPAEQRSAAEARRIGRVVALASAVEGLAILVGGEPRRLDGPPDLSPDRRRGRGRAALPAPGAMDPGAGLLRHGGGVADLRRGRAGVRAAGARRGGRGGAATVLWATIASFFVVRRPKAALA